MPDPSRSRRFVTAALTAALTMLATTVAIVAAHSPTAGTATEARAASISAAAPIGLRALP